MQKKNAHIRRTRVNDYPERQVGFPERNDASNPDSDEDRGETEAAETTRLTRSRGRGRSQEIQGVSVYHA